MNGFVKHNIEYISPSQVNLFAKNPAKWLVHVAGYHDKIFAPAFTFGNAIEAGITRAIVDHGTVNDAITAANDSYQKQHKKILESKSDYNWEACSKKQASVKKLLEATVDSYKIFGTPIANQKWVEYTFDDMPIPIKGILDYEYEDYVRDLKTASIRPKQNPDYDRQVTFYALATNKKGFIDYAYATTRQFELITFSVENIEKHVHEIIRIMSKMERLLSISDDIKEVCRMSCLEPDISNRNWWDYWGKNESKGARLLFLD